MASTGGAGGGSPIDPSLMAAQQQAAAQAQEAQQASVAQQSQEVQQSQISEVPDAQAAKAAHDQAASQDKAADPYRDSTLQLLGASHSVATSSAAEAEDAQDTANIYAHATQSPIRPAQARLNRLQTIRDSNPAANTAMDELSTALGNVHTDQQMLDFMGQLEHSNANFFGDELAVVFTLIKQAVEALNEDKRYSLGRLEALNKQSELFTDAYKKLKEASEQLSAQEKIVNADDDNEGPAAIGPVDIPTPDISTTNADGEAVNLQRSTITAASCTTATLSKLQKQLDAQKSELQSAKQLAQTQFQGFDSKSTAEMNRLSKCMQTYFQMKSSVIKNML